MLGAPQGPLPQKFPFRMVIGTALNARLDARCWSVIVSNFTAQWVEVPDGSEFVPPNTRQVIPLGGVLVAKAVFAAPPGVVQPAGVVGQTCFFIFTEQILAPSGGLVGATALQSQVTLERFLKANIPAAGNAGRAIQLIDYDRAMWLDTGSVFWSLTHEVFDVKAYGAKGDGLTNDDAAVNAALAALVAAGGGTLRFPPGNYLITSLIVQDFVGGLVIEGSGKTSSGNSGTTLTGPNAVNPIIVNVFSNVGSGSVASVVIRNMQIIHHGSSTNTTALRIWNCLHFHLENLIIEANGIPLTIQGSGDGVIENVEGYIFQSPIAANAALMIGNGAGALTSAGPLVFGGGQFGGGGANGTPAVRISGAVAPAGTGAIAVTFSGTLFSGNGGGTGSHTVFIDGQCDVTFLGCHGESTFNSNNDGADFIIGSTTKVSAVAIIGGEYWGHGNGVNFQQDFVRLTRCTTFTAIGVRASKVGSGGSGFSRAMFRFEATALAAGDSVYCVANDKSDITGNLYSDANAVVPAATYVGTFHFGDQAWGSGHILASQATAVTIGAPVANLGATIGADSNDVRGSVTITPTAGIALQTALMDVLFNRAMPKTTYIALVNPGNFNADPIGFIAFNNGAGGFTIYNARAALVNGVTYIVNYHVIG